ncbi:50S ribosomal protein L6e [Fonticula alba]|uniref:60S ribosomal protein L6 n=1 Tax=Fonticula alba TaxID=691883 RepID=A0A058ZEH8_FONAL|nr:50S ribosomal protein L6e [Fonticula alba]KCV72810.1 50S ribosomal protein L6e [Fonticula alba]|eukprot:XP_009492511.1 50S ribosomal protein L6e [Fonticula alba]
MTIPTVTSMAQFPVARSLAADCRKSKTLAKNHKKNKPAKVRASIVPGAVLILLAGRFKGTRVVCLKQLNSGLLVVSGPFKVNGVPLRRVNPAYVIATSTKVDISGVNTEKFTDEYFKRPADTKTRGAEDFFAQHKETTQIDAGRIADQKETDKALLAAINKTPLLKGYLGAKFTLSKGQFPHAMKF